MKAKTVYNLLLIFMLPIISLRLLWKAIKDPSYRSQWSERFGFFHTPPMPACIWIHTVSLGEAIAATPLIQRIYQHHPNRFILITTTTPTGAAWVNKQFKTSATHAYLPYDYPWAIRRFFRHFQPSVGIIMETELWPNTLAIAQAKKIPMVLANARLSPKSLAKYQRIPTLTKSMLGQLQHTIIQSSAIAQRFFSLGLSQDNATIAGNLKFNAHIPDNITQGQQTIKAMLGDHPCWIAASTHPGEEAMVLNVHTQLLNQYPEAKLILAPRHPERTQEIEGLLSQKQLSWQRFTQKKTTLTENVLLVDTIGELMPCFASSDVAFIGGSLIPRGGHNLIEPLIFSVPTLTGPHTFNFSDIHALLEEEDLCQTVRNEEELYQAVLARLSQQDQDFKTRCQTLIQNQQRSLDQHLSVILPLLA